MHSHSLLKRQNRSGRFYLKSVSLVLLLASAVQEVSWARADFKPVEWNLEPKLSRIWAEQFLPQIPESVAVLEDAYHAPGADKTLVLIQDAHTNISGQLNVARTLDYLFKVEGGRSKVEGEIKHVFLEAGSGNESLSFLRKYSSLENRRRVAKSYLMKGQLQGSEYLDLTSDHAFTLWGVEDMALYAQSLETYRAIAKDREKFCEYLARVRATVKILKPKVYNPFLLAFDEKRAAKRESLSELFELLTDEARKLGVSLGPYPHFRALARLKQLESRIDFQKASEEEARAMAELGLEASRNLEKLGAGDSQARDGFFAGLEAEIGPQIKNYPEFAKYFRYLKQAKVLKAGKILEEQKALEREILKKLVMSPEEETLLAHAENLERLEGLLNLTLTPDEFAAYQAAKERSGITPMTGFLNKKIMELRDHYDKAIYLESGYEDIAKKCEEFYALTYRRDQAFVENTLKKFDKGTAVLIAGGYHSPNLKYLLKQRGISYIVLAPRITEETNQKRYEQLLLSQNLNSPRSLPTAAATMDLTRIMAFDPWGSRLAFQTDLAPANLKAASAEWQAQRSGKRIEVRGKREDLPASAARLAQSESIIELRKTLDSMNEPDVFFKGLAGEISAFHQQKKRVWLEIELPSTAKGTMDLEDHLKLMGMMQTKDRPNHFVLHSEGSAMQFAYALKTRYKAEISSDMFLSEYDRDRQALEAPQGGLSQKNQEPLQPVNFIKHSFHWGFQASWIVQEFLRPGELLASYRLNIFVSEETMRTILLDPKFVALYQTLYESAKKIAQRYEGGDLPYLSMTLGRLYREQTAYLADEISRLKDLVKKPTADDGRDASLMFQMAVTSTALDLIAVSESRLIWSEIGGGLNRPNQGYPILLDEHRVIAETIRALDDLIYGHSVQAHFGDRDYIPQAVLIKEKAGRKDLFNSDPLSDLELARQFVQKLLSDEDLMSEKNSPLDREMRMKIKTLSAKLSASGSSAQVRKMLVEVASYIAENFTQKRSKTMEELRKLPDTDPSAARMAASQSRNGSKSLSYAVEVKKFQMDRIKELLRLIREARDMQEGFIVPQLMAYVFQKVRPRSRTYPALARLVRHNEGLDYRLYISIYAVTVLAEKLGFAERVFNPQSLKTVRFRLLKNAGGKRSAARLANNQTPARTNKRAPNLFNFRDNLSGEPIDRWREVIRRAADWMRPDLETLEHGSAWIDDLSGMWKRILSPDMNGDELERFAEAALEEWGGVHPLINEAEFDRLWQETSVLYLGLINKFLNQAEKKKAPNTDTFSYDHPRSGWRYGDHHITDASGTSRGTLHSFYIQREVSPLRLIETGNPAGGQGSANAEVLHEEIQFNFVFDENGRLIHFDPGAGAKGSERRAIYDDGTVHSYLGIGAPFMIDIGLLKSREPENRVRESLLDYLKTMQMAMASKSEVRINHASIRLWEKIYDRSVRLRDILVLGRPLVRNHITDVWTSFTRPVNTIDTESDPVDMLKQLISIYPVIESLLLKPYQIDAVKRAAGIGGPEDTFSSAARMAEGQPRWKVEGGRWEEKKEKLRGDAATQVWDTSIRFLRNASRILKWHNTFSPSRPATVLEGGKFKQAASIFLSRAPKILSSGIITVGTYSMPLAVIISILWWGLTGSHPMAIAVSAGIVVMVAPVSKIIWMVLKEVFPFKETSRMITLDFSSSGIFFGLKSNRVAFGKLVGGMLDQDIALTSNRFLKDQVAVRTVSQKAALQRSRSGIVHLGDENHQPLSTVVKPLANLLNGLNRGAHTQSIAQASAQRNSFTLAAARLASLRQIVNTLTHFLTLSSRYVPKPGDKVFVPKDVVESVHKLDVLHQTPGIYFSKKLQGYIATVRHVSVSEGTFEVYYGDESNSAGAPMQWFRTGDRRVVPLTGGRMAEGQPRSSFLNEARLPWTGPQAPPGVHAPKGARLANHPPQGGEQSIASSLQFSREMILSVLNTLIPVNFLKEIGVTEIRRLRDDVGYQNSALDALSSLGNPLKPVRSRDLVRMGYILIASLSGISIVYNQLISYGRPPSEPRISLPESVELLTRVRVQLTGLSMTKFRTKAVDLDLMNDMIGQALDELEYVWTRLVSVQSLVESINGGILFGISLERPKPGDQSDEQDSSAARMAEERLRSWIEDKDTVFDFVEGHTSEVSQDINGFIYRVTSDSSLPVVFAPNPKSDAQGLLRSMKFVKDYLGNLFVPFTILSNVTVKYKRHDDGELVEETYPFVAVEKSLNWKPYPLNDAAHPFISQATEIIHALNQNGTSFGKEIFPNDFGLDPVSGEPYLRVFGIDASSSPSAPQETFNYEPDHIEGGPEVAVPFRPGSTPLRELTFGPVPDVETPSAAARLAVKDSWKLEVGSSKKKGEKLSGDADVSEEGDSFREVNERVFYADNPNKSKPGSQLQEPPRQLSFPWLSSFFSRVNHEAQQGQAEEKSSHDRPKPNGKSTEEITGQSNRENRFSQIGQKLRDKFNPFFSQWFHANKYSMRASERPTAQSAARLAGMKFSTTSPDVPLSQNSGLVDENVVETSAFRFVRKPYRGFTAAENSVKEILKDIKFAVVELVEINRLRKRTGAPAAEVRVVDDRATQLEKLLKKIEANIPVDIGEKQGPKDFATYSAVRKELLSERRRLYEAIELADRRGDEAELQKLNRRAVILNAVILKLQIHAAIQLLSEKSPLSGKPLRRNAGIWTLAAARTTASRWLSELGLRRGRVVDAQKVREYSTLNSKGEIVTTSKPEGFDIYFISGDEAGEKVMARRRTQWTDAHAVLNRVDQLIHRKKMTPTSLKAAKARLDFLHRYYHVPVTDKMQASTPDFQEIAALIRSILDELKAWNPPNSPPAGSAEKISSVIKDKLIPLIRYPKIGGPRDVAFQSREHAYRAHALRIPKENRKAASAVQRYQDTLKYFAAILEEAIIRIDSGHRAPLSKKDRAMILRKLSAIQAWLDRGYVDEKTDAVKPIQAAADVLSSTVPLTRADYTAALSHIQSGVLELEQRLVNLENIAYHIQRRAVALYVTVWEKEILGRVGDLLGTIGDGALPKSKLPQISNMAVDLLKRLDPKKAAPEPGYRRAAALSKMILELVQQMSTLSETDARYALAKKRLVQRLMVLQSDISHRHSLRVTVLLKEHINTPDSAAKFMILYFNPGTTLRTVAERIQQKFGSGPDASDEKLEDEKIIKVVQNPNSAARLAGTGPQAPPAVHAPKGARLAATHTVSVNYNAGSQSLNSPNGELKLFAAQLNPDEGLKQLFDRMPPYYFVDSHYLLVGNELNKPLAVMRLARGRISDINSDRWTNEARAKIQRGLGVLDENDLAFVDLYWFEDVGDGKRRYMEVLLTSKFKHFLILNHFLFPHAARVIENSAGEGPIVFEVTENPLDLGARLADSKMVVNVIDAGQVVVHDPRLPFVPITIQKGVDGQLQKAIELDGNQSAARLADVYNALQKIHSVDILRSLQETLVTGKPIGTIGGSNLAILKKAFGLKRSDSFTSLFENLTPTDRQQFVADISERIDWIQRKGPFSFRNLFGHGIFRASIVALAMDWGTKALFTFILGDPLIGEHPPVGLSGQIVNMPAMAFRSVKAAFYGDLGLQLNHHYTGGGVYRFVAAVMVIVFFYVFDQLGHYRADDFGLGRKIKNTFTGLTIGAALGNTLEVLLTGKATNWIDIPDVGIANLADAILLFGLPAILGYWTVEGFMRKVRAWQSFVITLSNGVEIRAYDAYSLAAEFEWLFKGSAVPIAVSKTELVFEFPDEPGIRQTVRLTNSSLLKELLDKAVSKTGARLAAERNRVLSAVQSRISGIALEAKENVRRLAGKGSQEAVGLALKILDTIQNTKPFDLQKLAGQFSGDPAFNELKRTLSASSETETIRILFYGYDQDLMSAMNIRTNPRSSPEGARLAEPVASKQIILSGTDPELAIKAVYAYETIRKENIRTAQISRFQRSLEIAVAKSSFARKVRVEIAYSEGIENISRILTDPAEARAINLLFITPMLKDEENVSVALTAALKENPGLQVKVPSIGPGELTATLQNILVPEPQEKSATPSPTANIPAPPQKRSRSTAVKLPPQERRLVFEEYIPDFEGEDRSKVMIPVDKRLKLYLSDRHYPDQIHVETVRRVVDKAHTLKGPDFIALLRAEGYERSGLPGNFRRSSAGGARLSVIEATTAHVQVPDNNGDLRNLVLRRFPNEAVIIDRSIKVKFLGVNDRGYGKIELTYPERRPILLDIALDEDFLAGPNVRVKVIELEPYKVSLLFIAPFWVPITRNELFGPEKPLKADSLMTRIYDRHFIGLEETLIFAARVFNVTESPGQIALGDAILKIQVPDPNKPLINIYLNGKLLDQNVPYRAISRDLINGRKEIKFSMGEFKLMLDNAFTPVAGSPVLRILTDKKAVGILNLDSFNPKMKGFDELVLPMQVREINIARRSDWGKNAKIVLYSQDPELVQKFLKAVEEFSDEALSGVARDEMKDFVYGDRQDLKDGYELVSPIVITTPGHSLDGDLRHFYLQSFAEGDVPNFRVALPVSLALDRLEKLETTDPRFEFVAKLLKTYGVDAEPSEFIRITAGLVRDSQLVARFALRPITQLPLDSIIQAARLATKLLDQSA